MTSAADQSREIPKPKTYGRALLVVVGRMVKVALAIALGIVAFIFIATLPSLLLDFAGMEFTGTSWLDKHGQMFIVGVVIWLFLGSAAWGIGSALRAIHQAVKAEQEEG